MPKSLIHLILLFLSVAIATQPDSASGELVVVVYQVAPDGTLIQPGMPHVVVVAEEDDDELNQLLLEGFDFGNAEVVSLCPVEAACARQPANTAGPAVEEEGNESESTETARMYLPREHKAPPQVQNILRESQHRRYPAQVPFGRIDKNRGDGEGCVEVIVMGDERRCVVWRGQERKDGSSQRVMRTKEPMKG